MNNRAIFSQAIRYQKTASDNAFALLSVVQSNSEKFVKNTLDQFTWIPDYGKSSYLSWNDNYQKSTENLKAFIDKGYEQAEKVFAVTDLEKAAKKPQDSSKSDVSSVTKKATARKVTSASSKKSSTVAKKPTTPSKKKSTPAKETTVKKEVVAQKVSLAEQKPVGQTSPVKKSVSPESKITPPTS